MKLYNTRMGLIDIKNISGDIRFSTDFNVGSIGRYSLGKEDYITLPFNVLTPINFKMGDYVDLSGILDESLGGKFAKIYEVVDLPTPTYDQSTGGYNYELRLDAYYWKWKNKKFKYMPEVAGQEASWNLTASLDMQLGVFLRNLQALGYKYRGNDFDFSIDSSVEDSAKLMSYENTNLLDALTNMAETWNCEWWVEDNIIRFGRCENGDAVRIELGVEAQEMPRSESQGTYATRVYAFGSTRNIPSNYRTVDETVVVNGIVQKRLMLPEGTPYIDAYRYKDGKRVYIGEEGYDIGTEMPQEEAIEDIIFLDEVYPRTECVVGTVGSYTSTIEDEETQETVTQTFYYVTDTSGLVFDESYIIDGEELRLVFQSGLLNGMDFGVTFHKAGTSLGSVTLESDVYEIVANDNYGRTLPDETLKPTTGDKFILYGWDSTKITDLGLVSNAEQELRDKTVDCVKKMMVDDGTYNTTLASSWVKENMISRTFDIGQRIELVNKSFFETSRISRVIGLEIKLDLPYDAPVYTIGESTAYSRIGELENKVDNLTYKGQTYTSGGRKGVYIIRTNDSTAPSNSNVFSALRSLAMFLRKDIADTANGLLSLLGGVLIKKYAKFGDFVTGVSGGYIDEKGNLEMESGVFRKRLFVPEIAYNRTTYFKGRMVNSPGGGCSVLSYVDNGDGTYTITPDLTDADGLSQFVDDILTTYFVTKNSEGKLNGFEEMKFRVTAADYTAKKFTVIPRPGHSDWKPAEQMVLAQTGNFTDPERQTYILIDSVNGNNCITFFDNANTWDPEPTQMPAWFGKKKGMTVAGINADNYSAVLQNIIMTGLIFQVDEITGQTVRVPLDKGEWTAGKYAYYNRVSHNGALWLCVDDNGTTTEPSDDNPAWLKQVAEGQKGDPGLSVVGGGHWESSKTPYKANTMVTLANCVFLSKVETSNPPIRILRVKGGNFLRKKDGGYYLAGKPADWEVNEDWDMLLDGRELKGESITFLGEFATAPANPKNGDSYRNTTDRATYIYQDGRWQLMISDGKDGKGYEYIYTRGNIIDNTPEKPDSQQKDGYVPEGWTDNYLGTDIDHQVEWGCTRFKENGVWSEFSDPAVVHRWSKDGENAIMADFDNEMVNAALTSDGKVVSSQTWNTTVSMWYGTEKLTLDSITCTPDTNLLCATDKNTGVVTISVSAGATLAATNTVKITIRATKNGQQYSRDLTFTVAGVRGGANGADAILYSIVVSASSVSKDKNGNYSVSSVSCYRQKSVGGVISTTTDGILKYSIDGGAETTINNNTAISSGNFTKTLKFVFYVNDQIVDVETVPMLVDGKDGADGESITAAGHWESSKTPYKANTMVTLANCVFLSKVETSNPPIRILRVKGGNFLRKKDGGYYLAGKPADWEVNEDWDMLLDGRELKGESITFLGEFATAPANPKNGDSYRNTTDRATYIYQDGRWQLMISDGKDGKGYEYIYTRGNIIDNTPEKPDSQQKDGYVPEGWTDNYLGTDIDHQVEWGCTRFKENGVWSEFSDPAVVHRWSKDGENAIMADFDNEMVNAALTSDGKVVSSQTWNTTVSMWYGTEKLTLDSITCTPDTNLLCATDKNTGVVTISVSAGATLAATNTVKITIRATKNGQQYSRDLTFTVAGVRGGANGADAILYSIVVSASSVSKDKNGNYSVSSVSCYRQKSVGGVISTTTDGILKYSIDGGAETTINNNTAISSGNFTKTLKFVFYVNDQIVDVETVPMLVDGKDGADGESITAAGHWESANIPYAKNSTVSFAGGSYLSKVQTSNPPLPLLRVRGGRYLRKKDGGYILSGKRSDKAVNSDWQEMTSGVEPSASYWLDSPVSTINFTSTGTPSPSAFVVTMKQNIGGNVSDTNRFYLVARKYNGNWLAHVGATLNSQISVPATAGYTQFAVRAYKSASDANAWNNNFVAEKGVGVAKDGAIGATGATGAFPRDRGVWASGQTYVWNADYRDKVIYLIGGVYYNFLVKNYGASVTSAPTSANGDSNWKAMQKFVNIATDTLFADGANVAGFMFKNNVLKSHNDEGETLLINGVTGYFKCKNAEITGTITSTKGNIGGFTISSASLEAVSGNNAMLLSANLVRFTGSYSSVFIGADTFPSSSGGAILCPSRISVNRNITNTAYGNVGMYFDIQGSHAYDDNDFQYTGNHALYIVKGDICGFRLRLRRISKSTTLSVMDSVIMAVTSGITLTVPSTAEDGQFYWIRNVSGGDVTIAGTNLVGWNSGEVSTSIGLAKSKAAAMYYDKHNNKWFMNWIDCWN